MPTMHDDGVAPSLRQRLLTLRPDSPRQWGRMSVDQMLWHLNEALGSALGRVTLEAEFMPLPAPVLRYLVLNVPWPKGARTAKSFLPGTRRFDFEAEKTRCLTLVNEIASKKLSDSWPKHPILGDMTGTHWSALQAKHIDHHLKQFGA